MPMRSRNHDVGYWRRDEVAVIKTQARVRLATFLQWGFRHGRERWDEAEAVWQDTLAANGTELWPYTAELHYSFSAEKEDENLEMRWRPLRSRRISRC
jgi:hypothetical protein